MQTDPDFDVDAVLRVLGSLADKQSEFLEEVRALRVAAVSLLFVQKTGQLGQYREFFREFHAPASEVIKISRTFATREEAMEWLGGPGVSSGALVKIDGVTHVIAEGPAGLMFVRALSPQELEGPKQQSQR